MKQKISKFFSWISIGGDGEEKPYLPETVVFKENPDKRKKWSFRNNLLAGLAIFGFFAIAAVLYVATIKGVAGNPNPSQMKQMDKSSYPFELSPERGRYAHTYALAVDGSFSLSQDLADVVYPDVGYVDGRFYSFFAPGISIMAVPFYKFGSTFKLAQVFTYGVVSLFALGNLFFLYRIGKDIFKLPNANALIAPLIFGFASTSWSYATTLYQHHLTTFFILSSFYAVWKYAQRTRFGFVWAAYVWFAYAAAFTVDYPNLLFMMPVMIYFALSSVTVTKFRRKLTIDLRPAIILTSVFFIGLSAAHAYYNQTQLGDWKKLSGNIVGYKLIKEKQLLEKTGGKEIIKEIEDDKTSASFFSEENITHGLQTLLIAPDKGIFFFSPIFILAVVAVASALRRINYEKAVLLTLAAINIFLYASFGDPWGGWAFGPRYLILSMAILSLFIGLWLSHVRYRLVIKSILFVLFAFSTAISLMGVLTTNAVPPKVEADYLKMKYGYLLNLDYFRDGVSSSFVFNEYVFPALTLQQYFLILYGVVMTVFFLTLILTRRIAVDED